MIFDWFSSSFLSIWLASAIVFYFTLLMAFLEHSPSVSGLSIGLDISLWAFSCSIRKCFPTNMSEGFKSRQLYNRWTSLIFSSFIMDILVLKMVSWIFDMDLHYHISMSIDFTAVFYLRVHVSLHTEKLEKRDISFVEPCSFCDSESCVGTESSNFLFVPPNIRNINWDDFNFVSLLSWQCWRGLLTFTYAYICWKFLYWKL